MTSNNHQPQIKFAPAAPPRSVAKGGRRSLLLASAYARGEQHEGRSATLSGSIAAQLSGAYTMANAPCERGDGSGCGPEFAGWDKPANGCEARAAHLAGKAKLIEARAA